MAIVGDLTMSRVNEVPVVSPLMTRTVRSDGNLQVSVKGASMFSPPQSSVPTQILTEGSEGPFSPAITPTLLPKDQANSNALASRAVLNNVSVNGNLNNASSGTRTGSGASAGAGSSVANSLVMRNVYVSGLPPHFLPKDFRKLCQAFGPIEASKLSIDDTARPTKGYGFALFYTSESAQACIEGLNGRELCGRTLQARFSHAAATPKEAATRSTHFTRPPNVEQTRMNRNRPARAKPPAGVATPIVCTAENACSPLMPTGMDACSHQVVYHPTSISPTAWPLSVPTASAPATPYQQVVLINGQYYTMPATAAQPMTYYPMLSTPLASTVAMGEATALPPAPSPVSVTTSAAPVAPVSYTALPPGPVQVPGYYFLSS